MVRVAHSGADRFRSSACQLRPTRLSVTVLTGRDRSRRKRKAPPRRCGR